jgi:hypothetical protein
MISQEAKDMEPFMEEEVEESILPLMPWRAEVKATITQLEFEVRRLWRRTVAVIALQSKHLDFLARSSPSMFKL